MYAFFSRWLNFSCTASVMRQMAVDITGADSSSWAESVCSRVCGLPDKAAAASGELPDPKHGGQGSVYDSILTASVTVLDGRDFATKIK
jgi:hypothetical protein